MIIISAIQRAITTLKKPSTYKEISDEIERSNLYQFSSKEALVSEVRKTLKMHTQGINRLGGSTDLYFCIASGNGDSSLYVNIVNDNESVSESNKRIDDKYEECFSYKFKNSLSIIQSRSRLFIERMKNNWSVHKIVLLECIWMLIGAFSPIVVDSVIRCNFLGITLYAALVENTKSGEVFMFTAALITPFFFFLIKHLKNRTPEDELPYFGLVLLITIVALISGLCAFIYYRTGVMMLEYYFHRKFTLSLGVWAWIIYFFSLSVWYYSSFMSHKISNFASIREQQVDDLQMKFNKLKG
jgi:hypothetical protein